MSVSLVTPVALILTSVFLSSQLFPDWPCNPTIASLTWTLISSHSSTATKLSVCLPPCSCCFGITDHYYWLTQASSSLSFNHLQSSKTVQTNQIGFILLFLQEPAWLFPSVSVPLRPRLSYHHSPCCALSATVHVLGYSSLKSPKAHVHSVSPTFIVGIS